MLRSNGQSLSQVRIPAEDYTSTRDGDIEIECLKRKQRLVVRLTNHGEKPVIYETFCKFTEPRPEEIDLSVKATGYTVFPPLRCGIGNFYGRSAVGPRESMEFALWDAASGLTDLEWGTPFSVGFTLLEENDARRDVFCAKSGWPLLSDEQLVEQLHLDFARPQTVCERLRAEGVSEMRLLSVLTRQGRIPHAQAVDYADLPAEFENMFR
ncbi:MAG: hypothetical protein KC800_18185 [Candidatus Eremiobacteraeota bacterium]|nr:hypothetical protein [Candidatus Eremiobacteraeota bacterium]